MAVVGNKALCDGSWMDAEKRMYVGTSFAGEKFIDCLDNCSDVVTIDSDGCGVFKVKGKSCSVWVRK